MSDNSSHAEESFIGALTLLHGSGAVVGVGHGEAPKEQGLQVRSLGRQAAQVSADRQSGSDEGLHGSLGPSDPPPQKDPGHSTFLGNLAFELTWEEVADWVYQHTTVKPLHIEHVTLSGYARLDFATPAAAVRAMWQLKGKRCYGRITRCSKWSGSSSRPASWAGDSSQGSSDDAPALPLGLGGGEQHQQQEGIASLQRMLQEMQQQLDQHNTRIIDCHSRLQQHINVHGKAMMAVHERLDKVEKDGVKASLLAAIPAST